MLYEESNTFNLVDLELPYSQLKTKNNKIIIPYKYKEIVDEFIDSDNIELTNENYLLVKNILVTGYWLDNWYTESDATIKTIFYNYDLNNDEVVGMKWNEPKFIRLNSLSPKCSNKIYNMSDGIDNIINSNRCLESIKLANSVGKAITLAVRDWVNLEGGVELRCFIFEDRIKAICSNDDKIIDLTSCEIIDRCVKLFDKVKWNIPCCDSVMDIWLANDSEVFDLVIEFNSYGFWGNAGAGLFDWHQDGDILYNNENTEIIVRLDNNYQ